MDGASATRSTTRPGSPNRAETKKGEGIVGRGIDRHLHLSADRMASLGYALRALVPLLPFVLAGCVLDEARPPAVLYVAQPATVITPPPPPADECGYLRAEFSTPGRYVIRG